MNQNRIGPSKRWMAGTLVAIAGAFAFAAWATTSPAVAQEEPDSENARLLRDNLYCLGCHLQQDLEIVLESDEILDLTFDAEGFNESVHASFDIPCVLCHTDITPYPHAPITAPNLRAFALERADACRGCHLDKYTAVADNVHGAAQHNGMPEAAVCTDCHGRHAIEKVVPHSPEVALTCGNCHNEIYQLYSESVHGQALRDGNGDVPTCTDCHGVHNIEGPTESEFHLFSPQICADCHDDEALMEPYGLSTNVFESYVADFHGSTVILFEKLAPDQETNKPVCIDCHGVHAIKSADDPEGTVYQANILQTCQRCHPDAEENFSASWLSHYSPEPGKATLVWLVTWFYRILIAVVVGGMLVYVVATALRKRRTGVQTA